MPKRFEQIRCEPAFPSGPKEFYRRLYFEAVDFAVERKEDSTNQDLKLIRIWNNFSKPFLEKTPMIN